MHFQCIVVEFAIVYESLPHIDHSFQTATPRYDQLCFLRLESDYVSVLMNMLVLDAIQLPVPASSILRWFLVIRHIDEQHNALRAFERRAQRLYGPLVV